MGLIEAYKAVWDCWKATGVVAANWHMMDNKSLENLKQAIHKYVCRVEMTPPDMNTRNTPERAIQTFKNHFIAILAELGDSFPIHQWDCLLP